MAEEASIISPNSSDGSRSLKRERRIPLAPFLILALGVEIYFLLHDTPIFSRRAVIPPSVQVPIAELMQTQNSVRVRDPGALVWEVASDHRTLTQRQSLLTLEGASAEVAFLDGTGIMLGENTLIEIEKSPADGTLRYDRLVLHLVRGTAQKRAPRQGSQLLKRLATATPSFEIQIGEARAVVNENTEFKATAASGQATIRVVAGELRIQSGTGDLRVSEREEASISTAGAPALPSVRKNPFGLLSPRGDEPVSAPTKLRFRWTNDTNAINGLPLELEASPDPRFVEGLQRGRIAATEPPLKQVEASLTLPALGAGESRRWYWRVRAVGNDSLQSEPETFWRKSPALPLLTLPRDRATGMTGQPLEFVWNAIEGARSYELEWKQGDSIQTHAAARATLSWSPAVPGTARWRVRAQLADGTYSEWSAPHALRVAPAPAEDLPPPPSNLHDAQIEEKAPAPAPQHTRLWHWLLPEAHAAEPTTYPVHLTWDPVKGVARYRVQVAKTRAFKTILAQGETDQPEWNWNYQTGMENSKGRVFYRVASMSKAGKVGAFSAAKSVAIPKSILQLAKAQAPRLETYRAIEGGESLPAADPPIKAPMPAPATKPEAESRTQTATAATAETESSPERRWFLRLPLGFGTHHQSGLPNVSLDSPYLQSRIQFGADFHALRVQAQFGNARFKTTETGQALLQETVTPFTLKLDGLHWANPAASPTRLAWGLTAERAYRWEKSGPQSVAAQNALSLGPAFAVVRKSGEDTPFEAGLQLGVPLTGAVTGGFWGFAGCTWAEWTFRNSLGVRLAFEASWQHWSSAGGAAVTQWSAWVSPFFRFGPDSRS